MLTARSTAALALTALIITGCSTSSEDPPTAPAESSAAPTPAQTAAAPAAPLKWGTPATGVGEQGNPLEITPVGVYYHKGDKQYGLAENGVFTAVAVKVAATTGPDHVPPPITGHGFVWKGDGETINLMSGGQEPWVGRVNVPIATQDIQPGEHQVYVITFDTFDRGGTLAYMSPDGKQLQWEIPTRAGGQGLRRVLSALDTLGIKR